MVVKDSTVDLPTLLDSISWGYRIVEACGQAFAFRPLTLAERNTSLFIYNQALQDALCSNVPSQDDLMIDANRAGLWHSDRDEHLKVLQDELLHKQKELEDILKTQQLKSGRRIEIRRTRKHSKVKILEKRIYSLQQILHEMKLLRSQIIEFPSAEHHANHAKAIHIIHCATMTFPELQQKWLSLDDIQQSEQTDLIFTLINLFNQQDIVDVKQIRELARSGIWRIRWAVAKSTGSFDQLFDVSLSDLTPAQTILIHWSQVYDSAYEAYDRPPDYIIEDDDEFDRWLDRTIKEQEQDRRKRFQSKKTNLGIGKTSTKNANEVFVPVDGFYSEECTCNAINNRGHRHASTCSYGVYFYYPNERKHQEIDRVHESNPDAVRAVLASETNILKGKGLVREEHLRKYKGMARQVMGFHTNIGGQTSDRRKGD